MNWIKCSERMPEKDIICVVHNSSRPFNFYIASYSNFFKEFDVYMIGISRLTDPITFNATHWMPLPALPKKE